MAPSAYRDETLEQLREQIERFVHSEVVPYGDAWEVAGMVPREILGHMGKLGFLGIRYTEQFGGANLDTMATVVLTEALSRSTFAGFNITVLVHTDMASPHLARFGTNEQLARYMPGIVAGDLITAIGVTEAGAGSDVAGLRTRAERVGNGWVLNGTKMFITNGVHADLYLIAAKPIQRPRARVEFRCSLSRKERLDSRSGSNSTRWVGAARIPPNSCLRIVGYPLMRCLAKKIVGSTQSCRTSRTNAS